jgi:putative metallohydrolase (TIGR04338 family)
LEPSAKGLAFDSLEAAQAFVDRVVNSALWRRLRRDAGRGLSPLGYVLVMRGRGKWATANTRWPLSAELRRRQGRPLGMIKLPRWAWSHWVALHELAHLATPNEVAWHGREFARVYLELVRRFMGEDSATLLRASFKNHRVKFRPARRRAPLDPARRAALVERLAKARAARVTKTLAPVV